jgi:hypothetical protein
MNAPTIFAETNLAESIADAKSSSLPLLESGSASRNVTSYRFPQYEEV